METLCRELDRNRILFVIALILPSVTLSYVYGYQSFCVKKKLMDTLPTNDLGQTWCKFRCQPGRI